MISYPDRVIHWTPFGYTDSIKLLPSTEVNVLTPKSIVNAFRSGYLPQINESAR